MKKCYKNGKLKSLTFSFDDGNEDDIRLVKIFNKYNLKCTFNLNSSKLSNGDKWMYNGQKEVRHINFVGNEHLYDGHEVACHSYSHPHLGLLGDNDLKNQIILDKKILTSLYGYEIKGMAYPYGSYNDNIIKVLKKANIKYCRTVNSTNGFELPENPLQLNPTCHFTDNVFELAEKFISLKPDHAIMFYIWGHSYEMLTEKDFNNFEKLCQLISNQDDIWYATNIDIIEDIECK